MILALSAQTQVSARKSGMRPLVTTISSSLRAWPPICMSRGPHGSARNVWRGLVDSVELVGQTARVRILTLPDGIPLLAEVTTASVATLRLQPGTEVWAAVKAIEVSAYPA